MNLTRKDALGTALIALQNAYRIAAWFKQNIDLNDVFWIGGLAAVGYGIAQICAAAAWIVCGAAVFWMGVRR